MKRFLLPVLIILGSCHSHQTETASPEIKTVDTVKKNFLPVLDYLKSEIASVDSFPARIMKFRIEKNKTDSEIITTPVFDQIAKVFLRQELDSPFFEKTFEENSFVDRTSNLTSFTYLTRDSGYGLKRVDVLTTPTPGGNNKLSSIYLEVSSGNKDTLTMSKMSWKAGSNFRILQIQKPANGDEITKQLIVDWGGE